MYPTAQAQTASTFTPEDQFPIPSKNGVVSFSVGGSYSNAVLEGDMWVFSDLRMGNSSAIKRFGVSVENCSIVVYSFGRFTPLSDAGIVRYTVSGTGLQTFDFGLDSKSRDWSVILDEEFIPQGQGWTLTEDQVITISKNAQEVAFFYFEYPADMQENSGLSFFEKHSVVIATAIAAAIGLSATIAIHLRNQEAKP